ncbi:MAG: Ig domain-containing protein [Mediterranea sp.]|jgi:hypothetical protein|nr:Ig domain-containing protein [Mediterranea sp.]
MKNVTNYRIYVAIAIALPLLLFYACSKDEEKNPTVIEVTSVTLSPGTLTLAAGGTGTLTANIAPNNATDKSLAWSSSNTGVATADKDGKVTAVAAGTATITAKAKNGKASTCEVTVTPTKIEVTSVTLTPITLTLIVGEAGTLTATIAPDNATDKSLTWSSSNTDVATVDKDGKVTAVTAGTATITAKSKNDKASTCEVTITPPYLAYSNVYYDTEKKQLTFATEPDAEKEHYQGLFFKFGSLIGVSPVSDDYNKPTMFTFVPNGFTKELSNEKSIPYIYTNKFVSFLEIYPGTGYSSTDGSGDICSYISAQGWIEGNWKIPSQNEMEQLMGTASSYSGPFTSLTSTKADGTQKLESGVRIEGERFFPASGKIQLESNVQKYPDVGTYGYISLSTTNTAERSDETTYPSIVFFYVRKTSNYLKNDEAALNTTYMPVRCLRIK